MTWHKNGRQYNPKKLVHPSDGEAWTHFDGVHREKALEARNIRVALTTNGFNPYGMMATPIHLLARVCYPPQSPPDVVFQRQDIFLSFIIPEHPENNMGVFMEPVIDELVRVWEEGVWTYDRATKRNFKMHVWYHYSLHDFLALWDILWLVCSREVPMPSMQDSSEVHLVMEGWQVFFVRQTSIIPPS
jgi:hypothetical protein